MYGYEECTCELLFLSQAGHELIIQDLLDCVGAGGRLRNVTWLKNVITKAGGKKVQCGSRTNALSCWRIGGRKAEWQMEVVNLPFPSRVVLIRAVSDILCAIVKEVSR